MPTARPDEVRSLELPSPPNALDLTNDGRWLAIAVDLGDGPLIQVVDASSGELLTGAAQSATSTSKRSRRRDRSGAEGIWRGWGVAFTREGRTLHYLTWDQAMYGTLWEMELPDGKPKALGQYASSQHMRSLIRDRQGRYLAVLGNQIELWDLHKNKRVALKMGCNLDWEVRARFVDPAPRMLVTSLVESKVVLFDPLDETEHGAWAAPGEVSEQLVATRDGRIFAVTGRSFTGCYVYDTQSGKRIEKDSRGIQEFNEKTDARAMIVTHDDRYFAWLKGLMWVFGLPEMTLHKPGDFLLHDVLSDAWVSASALETPMVAFGVVPENKVLWFPIHE